RIKHVFLGGRQLDRTKLAEEIASPQMTPIPAIKAQELIDDFEAENERSRIDTLWINTTEPGVDPTKMIYGRALRESGNHFLSVTARMSGREKPYASINVPLSHGAVQPVDARKFHGIKFDVRGDGDYRISIPTYYVRDNAHFQAPFKAGPRWQSVSIDFLSLKREGARLPAKWTGDDLLMLSFEIARPAGAFGWLELDNVRFYR